MLQVTPQMRVLVAREPLDFRNGIDGTAAVCRTVLEDDPLGGKLFIFRNCPHDDPRPHIRRPGLLAHDKAPERRAISILVGRTGRGVGRH